MDKYELRLYYKGQLAAKKLFDTKNEAESYAKEMINKLRSQYEMEKYDFDYSIKYVYFENEEELAEYEDIEMNDSFDDDTDKIENELNTKITAKNDGIKSVTDFEIEEDDDNLLAVSAWFNFDSEYAEKEFINEVEAEAYDDEFSVDDVEINKKKLEGVLLKFNDIKLLDKYTTDFDSYELEEIETENLKYSAKYHEATWGNNGGEPAYTEEHYEGIISLKIGFNLSINKGMEDSKDYTEDYEEEDFKPVSEVEIEELEMDERIAKYIEVLKYDDDDFAVSAIMHSLPPKEILKEFIDNYVYETTVKYGKRTVVLEQPFDNDTDVKISCGGYSWGFVDFDKGYEILENLDSEMEKKYEEEHQAEIECDKLYDKIKEEISKINENSELKDVARIYNDIDFYSDIHKDVYGYRPRTEIGTLNALLREANNNLVEAFNELSFNEQWKLMTQN